MLETDLETTCLQQQSQITCIIQSYRSSSSFHVSQLIFNSLKFPAPTSKTARVLPAGSPLTTLLQGTSSFCIRTRQLELSYQKPRAPARSRPHSGYDLRAGARREMRKPQCLQYLRTTGHPNLSFWTAVLLAWRFLASSSRAYKYTPDQDSNVMVILLVAPTSSCPEAPCKHSM